jgi:WD40 repeat protein
LIGKDPRPELTCDCKDLRAVAFRDDGRVLAVGGRTGTIHLFDPRDAQPLGNYPVHRGRIHGIIFQHDSNLAITVGEDGYASVLDSMNGTVTQRIAVTTGKLFAVAPVDSQRVAVAGSDNSIRIVNIDSGTVENRLEGHQGSISSLASSAGQLFSGGYDATLKRWSIGELSQSQQRIAEVDPSFDR